MQKLTEEIKAFIVQAHACYRKTSLIQRDVKAEFSVDVDRQLIHFYHPEKGSKGKRLPKKWRTLFEKTRGAFDDGKVLAGISRQAYRIDLYQRGADHFESLGYYTQAAEMAEMAAKEMGGAYTNKRELTGEGGKPLIPNNISGAILRVYGEGAEEEQAK
jgi:hypothetical protein